MSSAKKAEEKTAMSRKNTDELDNIIGRSLQVGVLLSAAIILIGLVLFFATGKSGYPGGTYPTSLDAIFQGIASFKSYAVILLGLFLLILTPVFRVGVSVLVFLKEKDTRFVLITLLVFIILIVSFLLGRAGE